MKTRIFLQKGFIQIVSRPSCYFAKVPEIGLQQPKTSQLGVFDLVKGHQAQQGKPCTMDQKQKEEQKKSRDDA